MDTGVHLMQITQLRKRIAVLVATQYLALALAAPFLHRHVSDEAGLGWHVHVHGWGITAVAAAQDSPCPSCEWQKVARSAPPKPLAWGLVVRLVDRFTPAPADDPSLPIFGLASSRAPPGFAS